MGLCMLISMVALSTNTVRKDKDHLILEGRFIAEKQVSYEVFEVGNDQILTLQSSNTGKYEYSIRVNVDKNYLVKFSAASGQVKYLSITVQKYGYVIVDIDFRTKQSANLTYGRWYYTLKPVEEQLCYDIKSNYHINN